MKRNEPIREGQMTKVQFYDQVEDEKLRFAVDFPLDRIDNISDRHPVFRFDEFKKTL